ncbi:hypothetical protein ACLOJK_008319 [Asimina triloba]
MVRDDIIDLADNARVGSELPIELMVVNVLDERGHIYFGGKARYLVGFTNEAVGKYNSLKEGWDAKADIFEDTRFGKGLNGSRVLRGDKV